VATVRYKNPMQASRSYNKELLLYERVCSALVGKVLEYYASSEII
jgi:hypothetical protein